MVEEISSAYRCAVSPESAPTGAVVVFSGLLWAAALYLHLFPHIGWAVPGEVIAVLDAEIVSAAGYPLALEAVRYVTALVFIPTVAIGIWFLWVVGAAVLVPAAITLHPMRLAMMAFLPVVGLSIPISMNAQQLNEPATVWLLVFVGIQTLVLIRVCAGFFRRSRSRGASLAWAQTAPVSAVSSPCGSGDKDTTPIGARGLHASCGIWIAVVTTGGLSVGFFALSHMDITTPAWRWAVVALGGLGSVGLWLGYCAVTTRVVRHAWATVLANDAVSYLPLCILLLVGGMSPEIGSAVALCMIGLFLVLKIVAFTAHPLLSHVVAKAPRVFVFAVIPLVVWFLLLHINVNGPVDMFHEGERLGPASDVLKGKIPFRDIYVPHGLFQDIYKSVLAFHLHGVTLAADRTLGNNPFGTAGWLLPLGSAGAYIVMLSLCRRVLLALVAVLVLVAVQAWVSERHLLTFLTVACLAIYCDSGRVVTVVLAGVLSGVAIFNSLDTGLYACLISMTFLSLLGAARGRQGARSDGVLPVGAYLFGFAAGVAPFALWLGGHGALTPLFSTIYIAGAYQHAAWGLPFPSLSMDALSLNTLTQWADFVRAPPTKWYLPMVIYVGVTTLLLYRAVTRRFSEPEWKLLLTLLMAVVFFRSAIGRSDESHLAFASGPFWLLCIHLAYWSVYRCGEGFVERAGFANRAIRGGGAAALIGVYIVIAYDPLLSLQRPVSHLEARITGLAETAPVGATVRRGGQALIPRRQARTIERVVSYLQAHCAPDEPIFDFTNQGAYYFFADRLNATRYYQASFAVTASMEQEIVSDLIRNSPKLVLAMPNPRSPSGFGNGGITAVQVIIGRHIQAHYTLEHQIGNIAILGRNTRG
ncbi:MAG: hypothetical protein ACI9W2_004911 [Gammaproteobacteria bacterium]|jgi:hypothetical protein